jgi:hypothetical protein
MLWNLIRFRAFWQDIKCPVFIEQEIKYCRLHKIFKNQQMHVVKVFYSQTDALVTCLKNNFKIYIKIDIKTTPTCFGAVTIIREYIIRVF